MIILSSVSMASIELQIDLPEKIQAGEVINTRASILKIEGNTQITALVGQTLAETMYIHKIGLIERGASNPSGSVEISFVFIKDVERMPLISADNSFKIYLSNTKVVQLEQAKDFFLYQWKLPFKWRWWFAIPLVGIIFLIIFGLKYYPVWKRKKELRSLREVLWNQLLNAKTELEIMDVWNKRLDYFKHFPDLEKNFRSFEKSIYPIIFKQNLSPQDKESVQKSYSKFVGDLPVRRDYGV